MIVIFDICGGLNDMFKDIITIIQANFITILVCNDVSDMDNMEELDA